MSLAYEPLPGGEDLAEYMVSIGERSMELEPAWEAIIASFHAIEAERFEANGPGWLPLAESTLSMTGSWARQGDPDQILRDTGALFESIAEGGAQSYTMMTPWSMEVGTVVPYAHWHQTGGFRTHPSGAGWPPQRQIVDIREEDAEAWSAIIARYLFDGVVL